MTMKAIDGTRETLSKAQIADLKLRYGDELLKFDHEGTTWVFRPPSRAEFARFSSTQIKKRDDIVTPNERLALDCLVWPASNDEPDVARLRAVFDRRPGLAIQVGARLQDASGVEDLDVGKL